MEYTKKKELQWATALALELSRRREDDPLANFAPNPGGQTDFIRNVLDGKKRENWILAANRSGKSDAGAFIGATLARYGDQNAKFVGAKGSKIQVRDRATSGWVVSLDFPSSRDIIQPKYFDNGFAPPGGTHEPFIPPHEYEPKDWRISDQILKLRNGSIVGFKSADSGRLKFQGTEKHWIHFDEEPPEDIYDECIIRIGKKKLKIFGTCTLLPPVGQVGGVTWVYNKKVKPWLQGSTKIGIFSASIYDNPHIDPAEIEELEAIYPEDSIQRRIRLNGELIAGVGGARIYTGFNHKLNIRQQPEIGLRRPLAWTWDFNVEPMVSLIGQRERNLFRVFQELILEEGNIEEMCDLFRRVHPYHLGFIYLYGDATGKDRSHHTNRTSYQIILNCMKDYPVPIKMRVPESNPAVTQRINAMNRAFHNEAGVVGLEVDPRCTELLDDMDQVVSDGKGGIKKTFNRKDPYCKRTHTSDALGYWVCAEAPVRSLTREYARDRISVPAPRYRMG